MVKCVSEKEFKNNGDVLKILKWDDGDSTIEINNFTHFSFATYILNKEQVEEFIEALKEDADGS